MLTNNNIITATNRNGIANGSFAPQVPVATQDVLQAPSLLLLTHTQTLKIPTFRDAEETLGSYLPGGDNAKKHYHSIPNQKQVTRDTRVSVEVHDSVAMEELLSDMDATGLGGEFDDVFTPYRDALLQLDTFHGDTLFQLESLMDRMRRQ